MRQLQLLDLVRGSQYFTSYLTSSSSAVATTDLAWQSFDFHNMSQSESQQLSLMIQRSQVARRPSLRAMGNIGFDTNHLMLSWYFQLSLEILTSGFRSKES